MKPLISLRGRRAFHAIRSDGRLFEGDILKFFYIVETNSHLQCRIAVSVNKRYGVAVYRNRIKRRIRESFRYEVSSLAALPRIMQIALSTVVIYKGSMAKAHFPEIRADVARFFQTVQSLHAGK